MKGSMIGHFATLLEFLGNTRQGLFSAWKLTMKKEIYFPFFITLLPDVVQLVTRCDDTVT